MRKPDEPTQLCYEDVELGDDDPGADVTVDQTQMFFFSAATYNGHRIHYDKGWATTSRATTTFWYRVRCSRRCWPAPSPTGSAGAGGWSLLGAEPRGRVSRGGTDLRRRGHREARGRGLVDLEIAARRGEDVLMPGTATVALPQRRAS